MNSSRPSENRIKWTTLALNHFLPLFRSISGLRILKAPQSLGKLVRNTEEDAYVLSSWISRLLIENRGSIRQFAAWDCQIFYSDHSDLDITEPSDKLEQAFSNIADHFIRNQKMLLETDELDLVELEQEAEMEFDEDYL